MSALLPSEFHSQKTADCFTPLSNRGSFQTHTIPTKAPIQCMSRQRIRVGVHLDGIFTALKFLRCIRQPIVVLKGASAMLLTVGAVAENRTGVLSSNCELDLLAKT
jgi:hypothetical protein